MPQGPVGHTFNPRTPEVKMGGSAVHGQSLLHSEFEATLGYMRLLFVCCLFVCLFQKRVKGLLVSQLVKVLAMEI